MNTSNTLAPTPVKIRVSAEIRALAETFYLQNKAANAAAQQAKRARAELFARMKKSGISRFSLCVDSDAGRINLDACVGEGRPLRVVNVRKLRSLVSDETFMNTIEATQDAVIRSAGPDVLAQVVETHAGPENAFVAVRK